MVHKLKAFQKGPLSVVTYPDRHSDFKDLGIALQDLHRCVDLDEAQGIS